MSLPPIHRRIVVPAPPVRAAHFEDGAVTGGELEVKVRPWVVMLHGSSLA
jgi:hypothetical protein